jgi:hypothetical protein
LEPEVPFRFLKVTNFRAAGAFDFVFLAQSPAHTPPSADRLIPVIMDYIDQIKI